MSQKIRNLTLLPPNDLHWLSNSFSISDLFFYSAPISRFIMRVYHQFIHLLLFHFQRNHRKAKKNIHLLYILYSMRPFVHVSTRERQRSTIEDAHTKAIVRLSASVSHAVYACSQAEENCSRIFQNLPKVLKFFWPL